jgi:hypothetical protein
MGGQSHSGLLGYRHQFVQEILDPAPQFIVVDFRQDPVWRVGIVAAKTQFHGRLLV